jgi:hypothetical protein
VPGGALTLELWLHAEDDPTLTLPASLLWESGVEPFAFLRDTDPYEDLANRFAELGPFLAGHGIERRGRADGGRPVERRRRALPARAARSSSIAESPASS